MNELKKYRVIKLVHDGKKKKQRASVELGLSRRQVNRLLKAYQEKGKQAFVHGNRGVRPNHAMSLETKEKIIATPGAIKRLTVAVLIDEGLTQGQQDSISKVVASAAGFNQGRGDVVSVERIPFNTELLDQEKQEQQRLADEAKMLQYAKILLAVLAVVGLVVLWRMHVRRKELAESERVLMATPIGTVAELEEAEALMQEEEKEQEPTPEEKERQKQRDEIERLAAQNPDSVAQLIKTWLADE